MSETIRTEIAISGGGFVGLSLGLALAKSGIDVTLADTAADLPGPGFDGRVSSIAPDVRRMLETLGVWALIPEFQPVRDIVVSGGRLSGGASSFLLHFDAEDAGGTLFDIVENRFLLAALRQAAAAQPNLTVLAPARIVTATAGAAGLSAALEDGRSIEARLLAAADGRDSALRGQFGIQIAGWSYPQAGIVCTVAHERGHEGAAQEYFLPAGPFAILPMTGNRASLVWTERADLARHYLALDETDFAAELRRRFTDYLGEVEPVGPRWSYPLAAQLARSYIAPRFALAGDAAHVIHPIAGQGLNLGLRDVAALAEAVVDADRLGLDIGSPAPLEAYQRRRRIDATAMAAMTDGLNRLFSNEIEPLKGLRQAGLGLVNAVSPLRRLFARTASGSGLGETPRLLKGEAL